MERKWKRRNGGEEIENKWKREGGAGIRKGEVKIGRQWERKRQRG